jgi:hypothetical protein
VQDAAKPLLLVLGLCSSMSQSGRQVLGADLRAGEALALGRHALATARAATTLEEIEALNGVVVGSATLGSDLMSARILRGATNAIPV